MRGCAQEGPVDVGHAQEGPVDAQEGPVDVGHAQEGTVDAQEGPGAVGRGQEGPDMLLKVILLEVEVDYLTSLLSFSSFFLACFAAEEQLVSSVA